MHYLVKPSRLAGGTAQVPGDKSVSHRALMLGAIADGRTEVSGFLAGEDCLATLAALESLGVTIERQSETALSVTGVGLHGLVNAGKPLDLGNSGTAMRLFAGLLAGQGFDSMLTGDASLSSRPMARVIDPLTAMGAQIGSAEGRPPLAIRGGRALRGIDYPMPVASAQLKSALLLAGLYASGATRVREPAVTRDHTERMLTAMGARIERDRDCICLLPGAALQATAVAVPADLSSATFPMLAALISSGAGVRLTNVGINPTRDGVLQILREMGADISLVNARECGGEPVADIDVRSSELAGITVDPALVPLAIDEFPALFAAAACARGKTTFSGLAELRVKESDRIRAMADGLQALGIAVTETEDGAIIEGGRLSSGTVESRGDHRIAMAFAAVATVASGPVRIEDVAAVDTSFPGFVSLLNRLGADIVSQSGDA